MEDVKLELEDGALDYIVEKAMEFKLGARGLRSIFEAIITDAMFEIPSAEDVKEMVIDRSYAEEKFEKSKFNKL